MDGGGGGSDTALLDKCSVEGENRRGCNSIRIHPKRAVVVEPYIFFYLVSGFPLEMIFTQYIYRKVGYSMGIDVDNLTSPVNSSFSDCDTDINDTNYLLREQVQAATSQWTLYISLAGFLPSVLAYVLYGTMSDRVGRRVCFILPPIGNITRAVIQASAIYFNWPVWTFFFNIIEFFFGGAELIIIGSFAYITDTTDQRHLAMRMIIMDTVIIMTGGFSSLVVGYAIEALGFFWPMLFVIAGKFLALLYAIFLIPETVPNTENAKRFDVTDFTRAIKLFMYDDGTDRRWKINLLYSSYLLGCIFYIYSLTTLVQMNAPFCWDSVLIGYFAAASLSIKGIGSILGATLKRCIAEEWIIVLSRLSGVLEYAYIPLVNSTFMMFMAPVLGMLQIISYPMTRTVLSGYVNQNEQGALYAGITTTYTIGFTAGQIITNNVYSSTILFIQGRAVFMIAASVGLVSIVIVLLFLCMTKEDRKERLEKEKRCLLVNQDGNKNKYGSINP